MAKEKYYSVKASKGNPGDYISFNKDESGMVWYVYTWKVMS